jgi:adenylate cyclase
MTMNGTPMNDPLPMDPVKQAEMILGSTEGWPLAPVVDWLLREGCKTNDARVLLTGLADRLLEAGAPLIRLRLAFWTIHPLVAAIAYQWKSGGAIQEFNVGHGIFQSDAYVGSPAEELRNSQRPVRYRLDALDPKVHHNVLFEIRDEGGTDYLALPLVSFNGQVDSLFFTTNRAGGFDDADIAKFEALGRVMLPIIESISQHRLSIALLDTYVGERTGRRVLEGRIKRGDGELIDAALWFSDLRDFTHLTETLPPDELLDLLNTYFEYVFNAVELYDGEVLRFIGDAMLVVFPTDRAQGRKRACDYALRAAEDALSGLATMNHMRRRHGSPEISFGVGLHVGQVIYGNVGAPSRLDFTVMGPAVNRTARLEGLTKQAETPLLVSGDFAALLDRETEHVGDFPVKGIAEPVAAFSVK